MIRLASAAIRLIHDSEAPQGGNQTPPVVSAKNTSVPEHLDSGFRSMEGDIDGLTQMSAIASQLVGEVIGASSDPQRDMALFAIYHLDEMIQVENVKMTEARGAFHVIGELVPINGEPTPREDMVRVGMGTADIRYRGEFREWSATLTIQFNESAISAEQVINLLNVAGFGVGVGEWRPERNGSYGRFHVATFAITPWHV